MSLGNLEIAYQLKLQGAQDAKEKLTGLTTQLEGIKKLIGEINVSDINNKQQLSELRELEKQRKQLQIDLLELKKQEKIANADAIKAKKELNAETKKQAEIDKANAAKKKKDAEEEKEWKRMLAQEDKDNKAAEKKRIEEEARLKKANADTEKANNKKRIEDEKLLQAAQKQTIANQQNFAEETKKYTSELKKQAIAAEDLRKVQESTNADWERSRDSNNNVKHSGSVGGEDIKKEDLKYIEESAEISKKVAQSKVVDNEKVGLSIDQLSIKLRRLNDIYDSLNQNQLSSQRGLGILDAIQKTSGELDRLRAKKKGINEQEIAESDKMRERIMSLNKEELTLNDMYEKRKILRTQLNNMTPAQISAAKAEHKAIQDLNQEIYKVEKSLKGSWMDDFFNRFGNQAMRFVGTLALWQVGFAAISWTTDKIGEGLGIWGEAVDKAREELEAYYQKLLEIEQQELSNTTKKREEIIKLTTEIDKLTTSEENRLRIGQELIDQNPELLDGYTAQSIAAGTLKNNLDEVFERLLKINKIQTLTKQIAEIDQDIDKGIAEKDAQNKLIQEETIKQNVGSSIVSYSGGGIGAGALNALYHRAIIKSKEDKVLGIEASLRAKTIDRGKLMDELKGLQDSEPEKKDAWQEWNERIGRNKPFADSIKNRLMKSRDLLSPDNTPDFKKTFQTYTDRIKEVEKFLKQYKDPEKKGKADHDYLNAKNAADKLFVDERAKGQILDKDAQMEINKQTKDSELHEYDVRLNASKEFWKRKREIALIEKEKEVHEADIKLKSIEAIKVKPIGDRTVQENDLLLQEVGLTEFMKNADKRFIATNAQINTSEENDRAGIIGSSISTLSKEQQDQQALRETLIRTKYLKQRKGVTNSKRLERMGLNEGIEIDTASINTLQGQHDELMRISTDKNVNEDGQKNAKTAADKIALEILTKKESIDKKTQELRKKDLKDLKTYTDISKQLIQAGADAYIEAKKKQIEWAYKWQQAQQETNYKILSSQSHSNLQSIQMEKAHQLQKEELDKRKTVKQKHLAEIDIAIKTAVAIAGAMAAAFSEDGGLSLVIREGAVAATNAVALGVLAATPAYARGGVHGGGAAIIGEGGKWEKVTMGGMSWMNPPIATYYPSLGAGARIDPIHMGGGGSMGADHSMVMNHIAETNNNINALAHAVANIKVVNSLQDMNHKNTTLQRIQIRHKI